MTRITITDRRSFLAITAGAVAACAGLFAMAAVDPIYAALDAHREAATAFYAANARLTAEGLTDSIYWQTANATLTAQCLAGAALIDTAPTTRAGLRALEVELRKDTGDARMLRRRISHPRTVDGIPYTSHDGSTEAVAWFIAKRAAEIDKS